MPERQVAGNFLTTRHRHTKQAVTGKLQQQIKPNLHHCVTLDTALCLTALMAEQGQSRRRAPWSTTKEYCATNRFATTNEKLAN
mmetsp:Transcript_20194/g.41936  ORF Transcript_20194/g.41936 Transcript_20194/m.41936 type:complete len:84 (+) Transcript_20194:183-434(+)